MNSLLLFLIKSTLILSLLYLAFSVLMRKETFFQLNRMVLLVMVFSSMLIPFLYVPKPVQPGIQFKLEPIFLASPTVEEPVSTTEIPAILQSALPAPETVQPVSIPIRTIVIFVYLSGVLVSFLMFVYSIGSVLLLFRKARKTVLNGIRIRVVDHDIPAFSFGRNILISQHDFDTNYEAIITHEQSHIRLGHFYDLMLMELVKIIFWFNPLVYRMVNDLKAIHEFQADDHTLHSGIDAIQYQILIIKKCVGHQKFALANSFNHCQIKNRITMMNKQKTSKAGLWKVATFLPLLALLLMAFGKRSESVTIKENVPENVMKSSEVIQENLNQQSNRLIEIRKDGNYIDNKLCTLEEIVTTGKVWGKAGNDWIHLRIDESIPYNRIDEILEQLEPGMYHITQSTVNSNDIIYFAGDVSEMAKFTQGKWSDWMLSQANNSPEIKSKIGEHKIAYGFIVDRNGKVRDAHLTKRCDFPEVNAAYEKILTLIPDWEPAKRGSSKVSVYYMFGIAKYVPPVVKK